MTTTSVNFQKRVENFFLEVQNQKLNQEENKEEEKIIKKIYKKIMKTFFNKQQ